MKGVLPTKFSAKKELRIWGVPPPHTPFAREVVLDGLLQSFVLGPMKNLISFNAFLLLSTIALLLSPIK